MESIYASSARRRLAFGTRFPRGSNGFSITQVSSGCLGVDTESATGAISGRRTRAAAPVYPVPSHCDKDERVTVRRCCDHGKGSRRQSTGKIGIFLRGFSRPTSAIRMMVRGTTPAARRRSGYEQSNVPRLRQHRRQQLYRRRPISLGPISRPDL